jgi:hypothetical protein
MRLIAILLILLLFLLPAQAGQPYYGGLDMEAYNLAVGNRTGELSSIWGDMLLGLHKTRPPLDEYMAVFKNRTAKVLDAFEIQVSGQPATGGLLWEARGVGAGEV